MHHQEAGYSLLFYDKKQVMTCGKSPMAWNPKLQRARESLDDRLVPLRSADRHNPPARGWIRAIRDALGMSGDHLGKLLGVRRQSLADIELSEAKGTITLDTLRRAAAALDCTLVYALVPNTSLQATVETRARALAHTTLAATAHTMALEDQAVATTPKDIESYIHDHISERQLWSA
jgi:predicted DNA-binding mobile mystery protein A